MFHFNKKTQTTNHPLRTDTTNNPVQTEAPGGGTNCDFPNLPGCDTKPGGTVPPATKPGVTVSSGENWDYTRRTRKPKPRNSATTTDHVKNTFFLQ